MLSTGLLWQHLCNISVCPGLALVRFRAPWLCIRACLGRVGFDMGWGVLALYLVCLASRWLCICFGLGSGDMWFTVGVQWTSDAQRLGPENQYVNHIWLLTAVGGVSHPLSLRTLLPPSLSPPLSLSLRPSQTHSLLPMIWASSAHALFLGSTLSSVRYLLMCPGDKDSRPRRAHGGSGRGLHTSM